MAISKIEVFKINYETKDATWTAFVIAYTSEQAIQYIRNHVKEKIIKFNQISHECRVDCIVPEIEKLIANKYQEKDIIVKEVIKEVKVNNDSNETMCPWCEKEFASLQTLKTHIAKFHIK